MPLPAPPRPTIPARPRARWVVGLFFGLLGMLGVALHRDYGVGWDEQLDRLNGIINAKYVALKLAPELARRQPTFAEIPDMSENQDVDHGVFFQLPLVVLEKVIGAEDSRDVYFLRHLTIWLTCVAGTYALYRLAARYLGSWRWGLVVAAALVLSPRLFAESFYNYKDLVFLGFFTFGVGTLTRWLRRPTWPNAALHALAVGAAIDVRTMGVLLIGLTVGFAGLEGWFRVEVRRRLGLTLALFFGLTWAVVVAGWPYLWENPVGNFLSAFLSFSRYRAHMLTVYFGQEISVQRLPWHYALVWLLITTPLPYSVLFATGVGAVIRQALRQPRAWLASATGRTDLLLLAWFFGPLAAIVLLHSVIYDGWRHLYFIYPAFLLLAARGLLVAGRYVRNTSRLGVRRLGYVGAGLLLVGVGHTALRMILDHPYQNMYYSFLPGSMAGRLFERDYWGLSGREGVEWILRQDSGATVPVATEAVTSLMLHNAQLLLPPAERARLRMVPVAQARYFLTTYRWHPEAYSDSIGRLVYCRRVNGITILSVYRRPGR
ncbi:hypothetical protein HNQ93_002930 [Hymenobacter luteus]|uniref:Glycosyltransferase RgtA/B/C/D-like domain-containing protein n=2 Tax=Hymenobacter TaxID=89966 RepID=A0A7W9T433_9BACT|nr:MULTISPECIES: hypothetical protein [Hymenobacter]MBB4603166.1 hypothetical protein [Hymenobacter latericoloratus]MBB6060064.1 hypothetical protein [Hymenobacter luteus]